MLLLIIFTDCGLGGVNGNGSKMVVGDIFNNEILCEEFTCGISDEQTSRREFHWTQRIDSTTTYPHDPINITEH